MIRPLVQRVRACVMGSASPMSYTELDCAVENSVTKGSAPSQFSLSALFIFGLAAVFT